MRISSMQRSPVVRRLSMTMVVEDESEERVVAFGKGAAAPVGFQGRLPRGCRGTFEEPPYGRQAGPGGARRWTSSCRARLSWNNELPGVRVGRNPRLLRRLQPDWDGFTVPRDMKSSGGVGRKEILTGGPWRNRAACRYVSASDSWTNFNFVDLPVHVAGGSSIGLPRGQSRR